MTQSTPAFSDLALSPQVLDAITQIGYEQPSPIQAESIPYLLEGRDLLGTAQTGTGKTAAFALPLLSNLDLSKKFPQVLVLAPTRELAIQVAEAFKTYAGKMPGFNVLPIYGGQSMDTQLKQLRRGAHVVVGTPGRVMDHLRRGTLKLDQLKTVVLDEADEMLRMGFIDDVTWILEHTPSERQVALFSATMPAPIRKMANNYLKDPKVVAVKPTEANVAKIEQLYWLVSGTNKLDAITRILEVEEFDGIILFVRTKTQTVEIADKLEARGYSCGAINGDMTQTLRERTIEQLKSGKIDIVVATDVAARGIDVARVSHVINYDIPYDTEAYVHRIGRTGRAGRSGKAILFVSPREKRLLYAIEKATKQPINEISLPSREEVNLHRIDQFKESITQTLETQNLDFFNALVGDYLHDTQADPAQLAAALAYLAQASKPIIPAKEPRESKPERPADRGGMKRENNRSSERKDRNDRSERAERAGKPKMRPTDVDMEGFRIAVGSAHGATPGDIVGAIANETGIESGYIGKIKIGEDHSTIDLPSGMPKELLAHLKKVRVRQQPLMIERLAGPAAATAGKRKDVAKKKPAGDNPAAAVVRKRKKED
ncbi:MAG: ATP-dependent RNA helicase DeaD [Paracoccaceae bacterium]|jgi:ATP-dependent RNA helicase DeaD